MADKHKWEFKARFRRHAYGWKGTAPASKRLREATREIKKVAKKDPVLAADGSVGLMERLWPALQDIDTSSGYLGDAVFSALDKLIPILVDAPADIDVRRAWLERLYEAVQEDGVSYLDPAEERWGEICFFPELQNEWADRVIPLLRLCWSDESPGFARGSDICLSCLLEAGRYSELEELLGMQKKRWWHYDDILHILQEIHEQVTPEEILEEANKPTIESVLTRDELRLREDFNLMFHKLCSRMKRIGQRTVSGDPLLPLTKRGLPRPGAVHVLSRTLTGQRTTRRPPVESDCRPPSSGRTCRASRAART